MAKKNDIVRGLYLSVFFAALILIWMSAPSAALAAPGDTLEYEVISIDPASWIVTAKETATGETVKFRLPTSVFHGQTFDADVESLQEGQRFSVKGPRNARLNNLVMDSPGRIRAGKSGLKRPMMAPGRANLSWEIINVNAQSWIVKAKHRQTNKMLRFKVHPESFQGFRFKADLTGISKGQNFAIIAPNDFAMTDCASLLELQK